jgi:ABC-2 type transport system ATP-binding protein
MTTAAIRMANLTRDFKAVRAVDHLSLEVPAGTIFGFLGPNGAGKTTTIRLLLGLLEPTEGRAEVLGYDTKTQPDAVRSHTGALLEHTGLYEHMSAEDNLEFYGRASLMPATMRRQRIKEILSSIGLWERRQEKVAKWSKGMKQKLALARAMLHQPPLVLLDEPTAGLDVMAAVEVRENLASLAARDGVTVFLTTHNMPEAEKLCSQVAVIRQGKLIALGSPDELRARTAAPQVEVTGRGFSDDVLRRVQAHPDVASVHVQNGHLQVLLTKSIDPSPLVSLLVSAGAQVSEVRQSKASLEDVFVKLMEEEKS